MQAKIRDSRIELLRIISALLILCHHAIQHGGIVSKEFIQSNVSVNQLWSTLIGSWGQLGVTVFIIIASWFSLENSVGGGTVT